MPRLPRAILLALLSCAASAGCASAGESQGEGEQTPTKPDEPVPPEEDPPPEVDSTDEPGEPVPEPTADADLETFEAKVEIDAKPGGKRLQAVWLVTGGSKRVIDYRANEWWRPFEGRKVSVTGESYQPQGQAISASHFRVHSLELLDPTPDDPIWKVGKEEEVSGSFTTHTWPEKTKLAGETATIFRSDAGEDFWLHDSSAVSIELDKPVTIDARRVEPSNFVARPGGAYLWVVRTK